MANYATLKAAIAAAIKQNGNNEITGNLLQQQLLAMVNSLGVGYQYLGIATPETNPGTPDQNVFYLASTAGTYTNFGGLVLADGEIAILKYNGAWSKDSTGAASLEKLNQLGQEIHSGAIYMDSLKRENFIIGNGGLIRTAGAYSRVFVISTSLIKRVKIIPGAVGMAIVSFVQDVDFIADETITTINFSISIPHRLVITSETVIDVPNDCKYIVCTDESAGTIFTPTIEVYSGVDNILERLNELVYRIDSKTSYPLLLSLVEGVFSDLLPIAIKQGHLYSIDNNCGVNVSFVLFNESGERIGAFAGDIPVGMNYCVAGADAAYIKILSSSNVSIVDFVITDLSSVIGEINGELQEKTERRIDNGSFSLVDGVIGTTDYWQSVNQGIFVTRCFPVRPNATYRFITSGGNNSLKRIAFLTDINDIVTAQLPHYAGNVPHVISSNENEISLIAPNNALWVAVLWQTTSELFAPEIYELRGGTVVRQSEIANEKAVTNVEFLNAVLHGEEIEFVIRYSATNDKTINVSKDIYSCLSGGVTFNVSNGYLIAFLAYDSNYQDPSAILNNTWYSGNGSIAIPTPYFRIYIKAANGAIITPESGYNVEIGGAAVKYGQNKEYYLIAAQDSEEHYKAIADFIAGEDARPALQVAADEAYIHGTILKVAPGTYTINSSLDNAGEEGLAFSQFLSSHQYNNPYQGVTIEGLRKPNGYVGDAAIIKISETLYESINRTFSVIRSDPGVGQDWQTYFITTALNLKNLIIQIPDNQKPIHAIDLSTAEGGSRLEGLRIVGIPIIDGDYFPEHAHERSVGIVSNPGSTWNTNSYWNDIEIHGFYYGVHIVGMEHAFVHNLTVQWCEYGLKFNGGGQHPIQLIAVQDEHNVNLPDFGEAGRAIEISGYNASWPESSPGFPNAETDGWYQRKRATGNPIGSIEYTNNITPTGGISTPVDYPTYFEHGQGLNMKVRNMKHSLSGTSAYRRGIAPNFLQRYYDTDVNKELICVDTQNKTWVDTQGNVVP